MWMQKGKRTLASEEFVNPGPPQPDVVWRLQRGQQQLAETLLRRLHLLLEQRRYAGLVAARCRGTLMIVHTCSCNLRPFRAQFCVCASSGSEQVMLREHNLPAKMFLYNREYYGCKNILDGTLALLTAVELVTTLLQEQDEVWEWCSVTSRNGDFLSEFWADALHPLDVEAAEREDKERRDVPCSGDEILAALQIRSNKKTSQKLGVAFLHPQKLSQPHKCMRP